MSEPMSKLQVAKIKTMREICMSVLITGRANGTTLTEDILIHKAWSDGLIHTHRGGTTLTATGMEFIEKYKDLA